MVLVALLRFFRSRNSKFRKFAIFRNSFYNPDLDLKTRLIFTVEFEFSISGSLLPDYWWVNWIFVEFLSQFFVGWAWWWVKFACERTFWDLWNTERSKSWTAVSWISIGPDFGLDSNLLRLRGTDFGLKNSVLGQIFSFVRYVEKIS